MSYTIQITGAYGERAYVLLRDASLVLEAALQERGFSVGELRLAQTHTGTGRRGHHAAPAWKAELRRVRLREKKEYCGNHPGPCDAVFPQKKVKRSLLEWDDWVRFNDAVNDVLDAVLTSSGADVWSQPHDVKGKFWIRLGNKRRTRWDWTEEPGAYGRPLRVWNKGEDASQYEAMQEAAEQ